MALTLVVGGQKAGKSRIAMALAGRAGRPVVVTPCAPADPELAERVDRHRQDRDPDIVVVERFDLAAAIGEVDSGVPVVVDALDTWLLERMGHHGLLDDLDDLASAPLGAGGRDAQAAVLGEVEEFAGLAVARPRPVVVVAGVIGMGMHGPSPAARRYEDLHGLACQRLGAAADQVLLVVAGRALPLPRIEDLLIEDRP